MQGWSEMGCVAGEVGKVPPRVCTCFCLVCFGEDRSLSCFRRIAAKFSSESPQIHHAEIVFPRGMAIAAGLVTMAYATPVLFGVALEVRQI